MRVLNRKNRKLNTKLDTLINKLSNDNINNQRGDIAESKNNAVKVKK